MTDEALILDVDGTLVDSAYQHALAWYRAFRAIDITVPVWRIHRAVGMGGDRLVQAVAGPGVAARHADLLQREWRREFDQVLPEIQPFAGARDLLAEAAEQGRRVVLASSAPADHLDHYRTLLEAGPLPATSADDVAAAKPEPDLVVAALQHVGGGPALMVGDSTWDVAAAVHAGVPTVVVRTGGYSAQELLDAGALRAYDDLDGLRDDLADPVATLVGPEAAGSPEAV